MFRSNKNLLQAWITSGLLLVSSACTESGDSALSPTFETPSPSFSLAAAAGTAYGSTSVDTTVAVGTTVRLYYYQPTILYQQSGRNKVAVRTNWVSRKTECVAIASKPRSYVNFTANRLAP